MFKLLSKKLTSFLFLSLLYLITSSISYQSYAGTIKDYARSSNNIDIKTGRYDDVNVSYDGGPRYECDVDDLDFITLPWLLSEDIVWNADNLYCWDIFIALKALIVSRKVAAKLCHINGAMSRATSIQEKLGIPLSPAAGVESFAGNIRCAQYTAAAAAPGAGVSAAAKAALCCPSSIGFTAQIGMAVSMIAIKYLAARGAQESARICGHDWYIWTENSKKYGAYDYEKNGQGAAYSKCLDDIFRKGVDSCRLGEMKWAHESNISLDEIKKKEITNKYYREWLFQGKEFEDSGDGACVNPGWEDTGKKTWDEKLTKEVLGYGYEKIGQKVAMLGNANGNAAIATDSSHNLAYKRQELGSGIKEFGPSYQRYYMRGPGQAANYACHRFLLNSGKGTEEQRLAGKAAFDCCNERSQNSLCIENTDLLSFETNTSTLFSHTFCKEGEICEVHGIEFETYEARKEEHQNYLCAKTYSVCPYNHLLGGGTEEAAISIDENGARIIGNSCQYLKHCAKRPPLTYVSTRELEGAFISGACFDLKGDSQNDYEYTAPLLPTSIKNFSAPIAQCFKETMENLFLHNTGHTKCLDPYEEPDDKGECAGGYAYKTGDTIPDQESFFKKVQGSLKLIIKLAMTLAITMIGFNTLLGGSFMKRKDLSIFVLKLGIVMYFALGTAWQDSFFKGVFTASTELGSIFMVTDGGEEPLTAGERTTKVDFMSKSGLNRFERVELEELERSANLSAGQQARKIALVTQSGSQLNESERSELVALEVRDQKFDGCQFPRRNWYTRKPQNLVDADISNDLENSYPPGKSYLKMWDILDCKIAKSFGLGPEADVPNLLYMILGGLLTGGAGVVFFIGAFIFGFYILSIAIRALHIFLISSIAIVLLVYVSPITITCSLFKRTEGIFSGWWKQILGFILQPVILFSYLGVLITIFDQILIGGAIFSSDPAIGPRSIDCSGAEESSIYCIFNFKDIQTFSGLEPIGIGLPMLVDMSAEKVATIIKAAFVMFVFAQFLNKITDFASTLVGGKEITSAAGKAMKMAAGAYGATRGVQKRAARGIGKGAIEGGKAGWKNRGAIRGMVSKEGGQSDSDGDKPAQKESANEVERRNTTPPNKPKNP